MYIPRAFQMEEHDALAAIDGHPFATLVALPDGETTHVPVLRSERALHGHVARASGFAERIAAGCEVLAIFVGPHGYISPRWYRSAPKVPTWSYEAVHVRGRARAIEDPDAVRALLARMSERFEPAGGWSIGDVPAEFVRSLQRAILAFEIPIERLEAKAKLGQNQSDDDRAGAIEGLRAAGEIALADAMARVLRTR